MARIVWTEPALNDLDEIAEYIAIDDLDAAKRLVASVFQLVERLKDHPIREEFRPNCQAQSIGKLSCLLAGFFIVVKRIGFTSFI